MVTRFAEASNVHPAPETHFEIDPQSLIDAYRAAREGGAQVLGYFHSHPKGPAKPSKVDQEQAAGLGMLWAIWGEDTLKLWYDAATGFEPLSYQVTEG